MDEFLDQLASILDVEREALHPDFVLDEGNWDSLGRVGCAAAIDTCLGVSVRAVDLNGCRTVGDIQAVIRGAVTS